MDELGKQLGVMTRDEALNKARELGVDLVEYAPNAVPPVCKLINYKKFKYQESKKEREQRKKAKTVELKQLRLRPYIGEHDFQVRVAKARDFMKDGDRLKVIVQFFGRQLEHKEFGFKIINDLSEALKDVASKERDPKFEGRALVAYFSPSKGKKHGQDENQKSSTQAV